MASGNTLSISERKRIMNEHGQWIFATPVSNVLITNSVNGEFRVNRVLFINKEKLPRIRKRLKMPKRFSDMHIMEKDVLNSAQTVAIMFQNGRLEDVEEKCLKTIENELAILSLSQLGYTARSFVANPSIILNPKIDKQTWLLIESEGGINRLQGRSKLYGNYENLELNKNWQNWQKDFFFYRLLKVLNKEHEIVEESWRKELERAAILVGQSLGSPVVSQSFLWNMIALELLLTANGSKLLEILPERLEAFLGWIGFWDLDAFETRIREVYRKRNDLVHEGKLEQITIEDVIFTDNLLLNLFTNLMHNLKIFNSKKAVIKFSDKVKAERLLGIRPKVRPRSLKFIRQAQNRAITEFQNF
ncbi:MAG: hypothetical protein AAF490_19515 [Chloroflexota bacterium]